MDILDDSVGNRCRAAIAVLIASTAIVFVFLRQHPYFCDLDVVLCFLALFAFNSFMFCLINLCPKLLWQVLMAAFVGFVVIPLGGVICCFGVLCGGAALLLVFGGIISFFSGLGRGHDAGVR